MPTTTPASWHGIRSKSWRDDKLGGSHTALSGSETFLADGLVALNVSSEAEQHLLAVEFWRGRSLTGTIREKQSESTHIDSIPPLPLVEEQRKPWPVSGRQVMGQRRSSAMVQCAERQRALEAAAQTVAQARPE